MIVLIPAYEPDDRLVALVGSILAADPTQRIVVVDDGSGADHRPLFDAVAELGVDVVSHPHNRGKGAALKSGFAHIARAHPGHDVVCADCDGQHRWSDVRRVAAALVGHRDGPVLGARAFDGDVPARSRFGNDVTRLVFRLATGLRVADTQTGLRGYPAPMLPWLQRVPGDRFEYELEALLAGHRAGQRILEVPIATIYLDDNESSHFRPIRDSARVYAPFVRFAASSLVAFGVDAATFFVLHALTGGLAVAVVGARLLSATVNYGVNHRLVFRSRRAHRSAAARYGVLAAVVLAVNYTLLRVATGLGVALVPAKLVVEVVLAIAGHRVQHGHVFETPMMIATGDSPAAPPDPESRRAHPTPVEAASRPPVRSTESVRVD